MDNLLDFSRLHLLEKSERSIFIKDPLYGSISFPTKYSWLYDLVNTFEFQRLYRIRQLSMTYLNFPSAIHTRYSHCLGVYELCNRFINHFLENNYLSEETHQHEINVALATALLHDIGHGPLSHALELSTDNFSHEEMSIKIISSPETKINAILVKKAMDDNLDPDFYVNEISNVLRRISRYKWIVDLISSDVDIDRFDFLLRDSYYSGVSYGNTVDISLFIKWSVIHDGRFLFLYKAKNHLEHFFLARHHMYTDLYCNKVSMCYEWLLQEVFRYIKSNVDKFRDNKYFQKMAFLWSSCNTWKLSDFLELYDDYFLDNLARILNIEDAQAQTYRSYLFGINNMISCKDLESKFLDKFSLRDSKKNIQINLFDSSINSVVKVNI